MNLPASPAERYHLPALVGLVFIGLTFAASYTAWQYLDAPRVLGSHDVSGASSMPMTTEQPVSQQSNPEQSAQQQLQQSPASSTGLQQDPTQTIGTESVNTPSSTTPTTEIVITNPDTEVVIDNTDTTLVITNPTTDTEIATIPSEPRITYDEGGGILVGSTPTVNGGNGTKTTTYDNGGIIVKTTPTSGSTQSQNKSSFQSVATIYQTPEVRKVLAAIGISTSSDTLDASRNDSPTHVVSILYRPTTASVDLDTVLKDYQFKVWTVGKSTIALSRNGITTYTNDAIKLGLSKLSFKILTPDGELPVAYYPDSVWSYLSDAREISRDTFRKPIELVTDGGVVRYLIQGHSRQMLFAAIPVKVCRNIVVEVRTRRILDSRPCSSWDDMIDKVSLAL